MGGHTSSTERQREGRGREGRENLGEIAYLARIQYITSSMAQKEHAHTFTFKDLKTHKTLF